MAGCGVPKAGTGMAPEPTSVSVLRLLELLEPDPLDEPYEGRELLLAGCSVPKTGTGMAPERASVSVLRLLELLEPDPLD